MKEHWENVYAGRPAERLGWFQPRAARSLRLIGDAGLPLDAPVIDVGGGASTLVDDLLRAGHSSLTVLDLSAAALAAARERLGSRAGEVEWIEGDLLRVPLPARAYALWHDRAVFHFLADPADRRAYVAAARRALRPGGRLVVATFAADGPAQCSGLPVQRYDAAALHAEFGAPFTLLGHESEEHVTPAGAVQRFVYCCFRTDGS